MYHGAGKSGYSYKNKKKNKQKKLEIQTSGRKKDV